MINHSSYKIIFFRNFKLISSLFVFKTRKNIKANGKIYITYYLNIPKKVIIDLNWNIGDRIKIRIVESQVILNKVYTEENSFKF